MSDGWQPKGKVRLCPYLIPARQIRWNTPLEYIKNPMVAEFMGFHRDTNYSESELEQALIDERPAAELDNALMVEMRVGCKVQSLFLKSIIHGLRFFAHHCAVNNT